MKLFICDHCQQTLYFENSRCVSCGEAVGYIPELAGLATLRHPDVQQYRQCRNGVDHDACNWLIAPDSSAEFCRSCVLSEVIPDLTDPANDLEWRRIEAAKRRLLYTLFALHLPVLALIFSALNAVVLIIRIRTEARALDERTIRTAS